MPFRGKSNNKRGGLRGGFKRGRGTHNFNKPHANKGRTNFQKAEYRHQDQLTEEEVGISEYISKLDGYPAVIKARFSDFQVNEINMEGKMAKLTDRSMPKDFATIAKKFSYEDAKDSPSDKIPQEIWDGLRNLVMGTGNGDNSPVVMEAESLSKDERKDIHKCVKSYFGQEIVASTITEDGKTILQFKKWDKISKDDRSHWPDNTPEFVYFLVHKEMLDTMDACFRIAEALNLAPIKIAYAGVKDRRAKTTQWFCIKKYEPSKLVSHTRKLKNVYVGNIEFKDTFLKIDDDLITNSLIQLKEHGFINYYGLQRFGNNKEVPTFAIGIKLLQGEWKEAINLILKVKAGDDLSLSINYAKKVYAETGDAIEALGLCDGRKNSLEKKLLEGLAKVHKNNYVDALENIPRNIRLMYIHAYQSLIWNKMASKRVQEFGFKPVEGDLIFTDDIGEEELLTDGVEEEETESSDQETVEMPSDDAKTKSKKSVRPLTADELDKYTIFDVVLPLPGYDVVYPENLKHHYKEAIEACGLTLEMPKQKVRSYSLSGAYRKLVQRANDCEWKIMYYNNPTDNLIRSDLEELKGEEEPKSVENGKYKAVVVAFTLNPASYATMALREILKCDTSSSRQAALNNYGEEKSQQPKTILEHENGGAEPNQMDQHVQQGSLLADPAKYEDFKNSLFKDDIIDETSGDISSKRPLETEENEATSKKTKTDGD